ncbi:MAG: aconitate hydratase AcnA [Anaerolineae bacterium]|nr:aconitate hydratase AcnA [Anaerolineae bacterium]
MSKQATRDSFGARDTFDTGSGSANYYRLSRLEELGLTTLARLPFSIRVLLEAVLRQADGFAITDEDVIRLAGWNAAKPAPYEIPFKPARVLLQDFTGVPCLVDLAAMRDAMQSLGGDLNKIQPQVPVDLVLDHSVQVDYFGTPDALRLNAATEMERNRERFAFMHWGQKAFENFRVIPPGIGIVHQVNLEYLAKGVFTRPEDDSVVAFPDTLVGADSHTTMINSLGIVGWGVGGIEAEAVILGQPVTILTPEVIGVKLIGKLPEGATATDLALTVTQMLRKRGVVEKIVEFFGPGLSHIALTDRATIANMSPEYGATMGFFPVDAETLNYLRRTGRTDEEVTLVERYTKLQGLFRTDDAPDPVFTDVLTLDLSTIEPSVAGPKRPQDRVALVDLKQTFRDSLSAPLDKRGFAVPAADLNKTVAYQNGHRAEVGHGAVVIAAITSCTNTSNPSVMIGAGLLAKKAVERGLHVPSYVKTSMAPGSRVVTDYLRTAGLLDDLAALGFHVVGYGCTTCIGNSGPLPTDVAQMVAENNLVTSAVLSGNRNFEGRINPLVKANFLASPPLVVAYALAGTMNIDLLHEPLGTDSHGQPVFLRDVWPSHQEIADTIARTATPDAYRRLYERVEQTIPAWNAIQSDDSLLYAWDDTSTYIQNPPFFEGLTREKQPRSPIRGARILGLFGDSITTDHISPAGSIAADSPAGRYLLEHGVSKADFNQYGTRRGNDRVLTRGTFANIRIKNLMVPGVEGGVTVHYPDEQRMSIYDAAMQYKSDGVPLVVIGGKEYGTGSSRDWAAKGVALLGVRAVIAESFERTHRSNLVGMGVLPLQFKAGQNAASLGLMGAEVITIDDITESVTPRQDITVTVTRPDGSTFTFAATVRLDTPVEIGYYANGGIMPTVLRNLLETDGVQ